MRELKFRAWDGKQMIKNAVPIGKDEFGYFEMEGYENVFDYTYKGKLMQYIGFEDKHGNSVFEGDILSENRYPYIDEGKQNYVAVVEYLFAGFHTVLRCVNKEKSGISDGINDVIEECNEFEIIGNIYQNKELLECA